MMRKILISLFIGLNCYGIPSMEQRLKILERDFPLLLEDGRLKDISTISEDIKPMYDNFEQERIFELSHKEIDISRVKQDISTLSELDLTLHAFNAFIVSFKRFKSEPDLRSEANLITSIARMKLIFDDNKISLFNAGLMTYDDGAFFITNIDRINERISAAPYHPPLYYRILNACEQCCPIQ